MERGEYERAREDLTKAVRILRVQKPGSTNLTSALSSLAIVYDRLGDPEKAEQLFDEADRVARLVFPVGHPERATAPSNRALILRRLGRPEEAERLLREILLELPSPPIPHLEGMVRNALAATLADLGRAQEALVEYDRGIALQRQTLPEGHPELGISLNNRGEAAALLGRGEEAERNFSMALDIFEARLGKQHFNVSYPLFNLAKLQRGRGALEEAEQLARQSFQIRDATQGAEGEDRKEALELWIELLADLGRGEELAAAEALRN
jgi:tetratricopeptide (TPR) repeat protein